MRPPAKRFLRGPNLRKEVFERDKGVCAKCLRDTVAFEQTFRNRGRTKAESAYLWSKVMKQIGVPLGASLWHAHHVDAVADGGGESGVERYVTLCYQCHGAETRAQQHYNSKAQRRKRKLNRQREMREKRHDSSDA